MQSSSSSWMDEFFASFAYKKKEEQEEEFLPPLPQPNNSRRRGRVSSNNATDKDPIPPHPSSIRISIGGQTKVVSNYFPLPPGASTIEADSAVRAGNKRPRRRQQQQRTTDQSAEVRPPHTPDPKSRRRVSSSSSSSSKKTQDDPSSNPPSSWIRITLGDETKVVSNYFPLPTGASNPVVLNHKEVDKAIRSRIKRVLDDREPKRPLRERQRKTTEQDIQEAEEEEKKKKRRSRQLSAAEKKSDAYKRVEDGKWIKAPYSPYNLLQERHSFDPWRVLVICMLLNVTTGKQVSRVLPGLFLLCPNAEAATNVPEEEIEKEIQSLGIHTKRAKMIKQLSREYLGSEWTHVTQLHGVGKYAADAYAIFCAGKAGAVIPVDHMLVKYWKFVCGNWEG